MRLIKILFLLLMVFVGLEGFSQTKISGKVMSENDSLLSKATITLKGTKTTTTTNEEGAFSLTSTTGSKNTLIISFVGYETKTILLEPNQTDVTIKLKLASQQLNDVVLIGYGSLKKKDLTGSVSSINKDHLNLGGTTANVAQAIQGRAAGVQVQQSSFAPGGAIAVTIRGGNSINTTSEPLYVVDGFITDNGKFINPNDIDDIQILKDASATAIYGARGGNGVILITTKKGSRGKMQIDADVSKGWQYLTYNPTLLNGEQYASIQNATAAEDGRPPVFPPSFQLSNTNWYDSTTQQASITNATISLSSNDKNSKFYVSGNYFNQNGVLLNTGLKRYTGRIGVEKNFSENVLVGANFYGAVTNSSLQRYNADITAPLYAIYTAPPSIPVHNADGSYYRYNGKDNALASLVEPTNVATSRLVNANMFINYEIIKNLTFHFSIGSEFNQATAGQYIPRTLTAGAANGGIAQEQMSTNIRWLSEEYLTYKFVTGLHSFTALVGASSQKDVTEGLGAGSSNFSSDVFLFYNLYAGANPTVQGSQVPNSSKIESKLKSFYGRLNYSFDDKLLATFTLRDDGSSRFGPNNQHALFPSGALAYKLTNIPFIQNLNTFSSLKIRASYGIAGNDRIGDYAYMSRFSPYGVYIGSGFVSGIEPASLSNNNLQWEQTAQSDIGLDMSFLRGKLSATLDVYKKVTNNLLLAVPVGSWWGFSTQLTNAGSIENKGIELSVSYNFYNKEDFTWNMTLNGAYNKQQVISLANGVSKIAVNTANPSGTVSGRQFSLVEPGKELGIIYGYQYAGVVKTGEAYAPQPNSKPGDPKYVDVNGDGKITPTDQAYLGNTTPHYTLGFGNDFKYKGFDLNIFFQGAFGYHLYNMNRLVLESTTSTDALDRWVAVVNENTNIPREGYFLSSYGSYVNSRFVENASYLRLKNLNLGYNLPANILAKTKFIDGVRFYASAQNLLTFTSYTGTDPEVNTHSGSNIAGGIDFNSFPAFRTFTFGIRLTIH